MSKAPPLLFALSLADDVGELGRLSQWVGVLNESGAFNARDSFRVELALTEAVTNIMMHGLPRSSPKKIELKAQLSASRLEVHVEDEGIPFNPLDHPLKPRPETLEQATPGGLGLILIRAYCDEASYHREGDWNRLCLAFHAGGAPSPVGGPTPSRA